MTPPPRGGKDQEKVRQIRGSANSGPYHQLSRKAKVREVDRTTVVRYSALGHFSWTVAA